MDARGGWLPSPEQAAAWTWEAQSPERHGFTVRSVAPGAVLTAPEVLLTRAAPPARTVTSTASSCSTGPSVEPTGAARGSGRLSSISSPPHSLRVGWHFFPARPTARMTLSR